MQNAVQDFKNIDLSSLPKKVKSDLERAVSDADLAIVSLKKALDQETKIKEEAIKYKPFLRQVRRIESQINRRLRDIKDLKKDQVLQKTLKNMQSVEEIEKEIGYIQNDIDNLKAKIPASWPQTYKEFKALMKEEEKLRNIYRRKGENSYQSIKKVADILESSQEITLLKDEYYYVRDNIKDIEKFWFLCLNNPRFSGRNINSPIEKKCKVVDNDNSFTLVREIKMNGYLLKKYKKT